MEDKEIRPIAYQYVRCLDRLRNSVVDARDLQLWASELFIEEGRLDRSLRRSQSLRQLLLANLRHLEDALQDDQTLHQQVSAGLEVAIDRQAKVKGVIPARIYDLLCMSSELRDPLPSDNLDLLTEANIKAKMARDIQRVSELLPDAAESLQRRIGILFWMRKRELEKLHQVKARTIPVYTGDMHFHAASQSMQPEMELLRLATFFLTKFHRCPLCVKPPGQIQHYDKNHIVDDLEPYLCTFGNCAQAYQMFRKHEWEEHERVFHKFEKKWRCYLCRGAFGTNQSFLSHIESTHPKWADAAKVEVPNSQASDQLLAQLSEQRHLLNSGQGACPFCTQQDISDLTDHVAFHMECVFLQMLRESKIIEAFIDKVQNPSTKIASHQKAEAETFKVRFYGSWNGELGLDPWISTSLTGRIWKDIKTSASSIWAHPRGFLPLRTRRLNPFHESYPTPANLFCFMAHAVLFSNQLVLLAFLPLLLFLPPSAVVLFVTMFLLVNHFVSKALNGNIVFIDSSSHWHTPIRAPAIVHSDSEKWLFVNGSLAGKHWLMLNIDRLSAAVGREVLGIQNKTLGPEVGGIMTPANIDHSHGIIFDLIETLFQRHFGYVTTSTQECYKALKSELCSPTTEKIVLVLHGKGAVVGSNALDLLLRELPRDLFSKLEIYTFGSAATHFYNPFWEPPPNTRHQRQRAQRRILGHIEHYALSCDLATLISRPELTSGYDADPNPNIAGQIFEIEGAGWLFNGDYMDTIFPWEPSGLSSEASDFMEVVPEIQEEPRRGDLRQEKTILDSESSFEDRDMQKDSRDSRSVRVGKLKVKDLSRLWQYRNGRSPAPREDPRSRLARL